MIEQHIVSKLDTITALRGKCYPVAAPIGDETPPLCLYRRTAGNIQWDLSGQEAFCTDQFQIDLLGDDMDFLCSLEREVIDALCEQNVDADDIYIYSGSAAPGVEDGFDLSIELISRSLIYSVTYGR